MTRLIDADALKIKVEAMVEHKVLESDYDYGCNQTLDYVADILIDNAPTIDAEPVVRCIDCIFWYDCEYPFKSEKGFCCCGERREP